MLKCFRSDRTVLAASKDGMARHQMPLTRCTVTLAAAIVCIITSLLGLYILGRWSSDIPLHTIDAHKWPLGITALHFFPDGGRILSASKDGTIKFWDISTGSLTSSLSVDSPVYCAALSPDAELLATNCETGGIAIWRTPFSRREKTLAYSGCSVRCAMFAPRGSVLAYSGMGGTIDLADARTGNSVGTLRSGERSDGSAVVVSLAFAPDGGTLAAASEDGTVVLWNTKLLRSKLRMTIPGGLARSLAFSPDGTILAVGTRKGVVEIVDVRAWRMVRSLRCCDDSDDVWSLAFSPNGRMLACGGGFTYPVVKLFNPRNGRVIGSLQSSRFGGHRYGAIRCSYSPDGTLLATGAWDGTICIWAVK
jgi:WD40 repeat protein